MNVPRSASTETAWKGSGGGVSEYWPMSQWQQPVIPSQANNDGSKCGDFADRCRESPDIALDANPNTGYMYYCTVSAAVCGSPVGWLAIGGTSAAAPLMAGITADANNSAGVDLGFASPFLYSQIGTSVFHDITSGTNNLTGGAKYTAGAGYDMVTGLGSVNAQNLATALHTHGPVDRDRASHHHPDRPCPGTRDLDQVRHARPVQRNAHRHRRPGRPRAGHHPALRTGSSSAAHRAPLRSQAITRPDQEPAQAAT